MDKESASGNVPQSLRHKRIPHPVFVTSSPVASAGKSFLKIQSMPPIRQPEDAARELCATGLSAGPPAPQTAQTPDELKPPRRQVNYRTSESIKK